MGFTVMMKDSFLERVYFYDFQYCQYKFAYYMNTFMRCLILYNLQAFHTIHVSDVTTLTHLNH